MREVDIRPVELLDEYLRLSALDAKRLFSNGDMKETRSCPGCGESFAKFQYKKNGFNLVRCKQCASLFVNPAPTMQALQLLYKDSPSAEYWAKIFMPAVVNSRREKIFKPRAREILALISRLGGTATNIVDVGAGAGLLLEELKTLSPDANICALEPGTEQAVKLRAKGIKTFEGYVEELSGDARLASTADLVICCELIEHVTDTLDFLRALSGLAKPGGHILITGLSSSGFDIEVLGGYSNAVSPPHHLTFLSRRGVESLVKRSGLKLVSFETPGKLDVDIVRNALNKNPELEIDRFIRNLILESDKETRESLQRFLSGNALSSHMWVVVQNSKSSPEIQNIRCAT